MRKLHELGLASTAISSNWNSLIITAAYAVLTPIKAYREIIAENMNL